MTISDTIIVAIIGLITGATGSLVASWVKWGIEKKRLKHNRRVDLIKEWPIFIEQFDFEKDNFGNTTVYGAMRPYMNSETVKKFEAQRRFYVPPDGGRGKNLFKQWASDEVSKIEKNWKLI